MVIVRHTGPLPRLTELPRKLASRLGYDPKNPPDNKITNAINELVLTVPERFSPRGLYKIINVKSIDKDAIHIGHGVIKSPMFARLAGECGGEKSMVIWIATAGEEWLQGFVPDGSCWHDLLIDALGSELAELAAAMVEEKYKDDAKSHGLQASVRISPGYCDWGLEGQELIFESLDAQKIGVSLTPYFVMTPAKTVSGAALLAENIAFDAPCAFCSRDCPHRRFKNH